MAVAAPARPFLKRDRLVVGLFLTDGEALMEVRDLSREKKAGRELPTPAKAWVEDSSWYLDDEGRGVWIAVEELEGLRVVTPASDEETAEWVERQGLDKPV